MEHAHPTGQQPQEVQGWHTIKTVVYMLIESTFLYM